ncbi:MAG: amidohydrolase family protein [Acidobacteria bacterium]|nr:amidohydrolase family protein [Acidobacteriota bacterium]
MNHRHLVRCVIVGFAALVAVVPLESQAPALAIAGTTVVDVVEGRLTPNATVVTTGDVITSITPGGSPPAGARVIDGAGTFLIPGLWDMHAHMEGAGEAWLPLYVANGVTGIRDMGSNLDLILRMRESTASGGVLGPRIFAAGPILDDAPGEWPFRMRVRTAADGRAAVQLLKRGGADLVKVHDHTPRDVFFAIVDEARRQNLPVAGHVPLKVTVEEAIDAGQTNIEHLSNTEIWEPCSGGDDYRPERCRPFFEMLAQRRIWQTPTLAFWSEVAVIGTPASTVRPDQMAYATRSIRDGWAANQRAFVTPELTRILKERAVVGAIVVRDMARAGVPILAGCDGMIAGFCVHDELATMVRGGMTPLAALQTATLNPARYLGLEQTAGTMAPGRRADLVLLDANPLTDITNVRRIRAVVAAGRFLDRAELDGLLEKVKAAAAQP